MRLPVGIVGMGLVTPLGLGVEPVYRRMSAGECALRPIDRFPVDAYGQQQGGQLEADDETTVRRDADTESLAAAMIRHAASQAMRGLEPIGDATRFGLVLASNFGFMDLQEWCWRERLDTGEMDEATFVAQQDVLAVVGDWVGTHGPRAELSLSCASGAAALSLAADWLQVGLADQVLVVGYDVLTEFCWCGLSNLRTVTDDRIRPFDERRRGTIFSEGAAAVVLRARPTGEVQAWLAGAGTNNNAFHMTAPCREASGSRRVMEAALAEAGLPPRSIDFVSAHATGTKANDLTESQAINALFPQSREGCLPVAAFKSHLGHLMGAAGLAEAVASIAAMRHGAIPPAVNLEQQDTACAVDVVRGTARTAIFTRAVTNSAGIGGNNSATVLSLAEPVCQGECPPATTVFLRAAGWVLPDSAAAGPGLPEVDPDDLMGRNAALLGFSAKGYLKSVKGYLDPSGAFSLAAVALCLERVREAGEPAADWGIVAATQFGAPTSQYRFFGQMVAKGPRFASPMVFPHGYANTPSNLAAIEFGLAGPHLVFDRSPDHVVPLASAVALLTLGKCSDLLFICYEAVSPEHLPDGWPCLNGAVCMWLSIQPGAGGAPVSVDLSDQPTSNRSGTVYSLLRTANRLASEA